MSTAKQCCNGETWKCGDTLFVFGSETPSEVETNLKYREDCQPGTCFSGNCIGFPSEYSMDVRCGYQHNNLTCGGKWGDCCNLDGRCGTGESFCDPGKCQKGNCTIVIVKPVGPVVPIIQPTTSTVQPSARSTSISTDGSCGGLSKLKCGGSGFGDCCSSSGYCGSSVDYCGQGW